MEDEAESNMCGRMCVGDWHVPPALVRVADEPETKHVLQHYAIIHPATTNWC